MVSSSCRCTSASTAYNSRRRERPPSAIATNSERGIGLVLGGLHRLTDEETERGLGLLATTSSISFTIALLSVICVKPFFPITVVDRARQSVRLAAEARGRAGKRRALRPPPGVALKTPVGALAGWIPAAWNGTIGAARARP